MGFAFNAATGTGIDPRVMAVAARGDEEIEIAAAAISV